MVRVLRWHREGYGANNIRIHLFVTNPHFGKYVRQVSGKGFVAVSNTQSFGAGQTDVLLIKTDGNGNLRGMIRVQRNLLGRV
jgi:hypothetical protein